MSMIEIINGGVIVGEANVDEGGIIRSVTLYPDNLDRIVPGIKLSEELTLADIEKATIPFLQVDMEFQLAYFRKEKR